MIVKDFRILQKLVEQMTSRMICDEECRSEILHLFANLMAHVSDEQYDKIEKFMKENLLAVLFEELTVNAINVNGRKTQKILYIVL